MAVTTKLQIIKPVSENDASKVTTYNEGFNDLDAALAGLLNLSVAGSANITLTRAQAVNRILKFTGVLTGNITVYLPAVANLALSPPTTTVGSVARFTVWNATTGAFTLTVKTSAVGSVGAAIAQATKVNCFHDGTDVFADATTGGAVMTSGDYGAADGSLPAGTEATFYRNTNASSKRLFLYNGAAFRAIFQAGIDLINLASNVTGLLPFANIDQTASLNDQTGTTYTLVAGDKGKAVTLSNASAITLTLPSGLGVGFNCLVVQKGAGQVTFTASGSTIRQRQSHTKTAGIYAVCSLVSHVADEFLLGGDTTT